MLSIIICTYNRDKYLYGALQSIAENGFPIELYEIVLIDNNSTDNTVIECKRFERNYPDVDFHYYLETKQGLSHARNRGIEESHYDFLVFLDDDSYIQEHYLSNLKRQLESHPNTDAFGGKIIPIFESGVAPAWLSKWTYSWVSAIDNGNQVQRFSRGSFPIGANMGISKAVIRDVGVFNTQLGRSKKNLMGGEEKDLFDRITDQGKIVYYFPNVEVHHIIPDSRTTKDYIIKMSQGIGASERIRTLSFSRLKFIKRLLSELIKWGGTLWLWVSFACQGKTQKGNILVLFRYHVTKGLLNIS